MCGVTLDLLQGRRISGGFGSAVPPVHVGGSSSPMHTAHSLLLACSSDSGAATMDLLTKPAFGKRNGVASGAHASASISAGANASAGRPDWWWVAS